MQAELVHANPTPENLGHPVSDVLMYDPLDEWTSVGDRIILAVGFSLGSADFEGERLKVATHVPTGELFEGVTAVLSHMIRQLRGDARFEKMLIYTRHRLLQHLSARHDRYSRLGLLDTVDRILG